MTVLQDFEEKKSRQGSVPPENRCPRGDLERKGKAQGALSGDGLRKGLKS